MNTAKEELRSEYKRIRLGMDKSEAAAWSQVICEKLLAEADWPKVKGLHAYKPVVKLNEIDTTKLLAAIRKRYPFIDITVAGSSKNENIPNRKFDLVIVPVLAFDKNNYRLGWGGGWYDRFLAGQPQAMKIGLCFKNGFINGVLPNEPHDIPLDKIITEV